MTFLGDAVLGGDAIGRDQIQIALLDWGYVPLDRGLLTPRIVYQDRGAGYAVKVIRSLVDIGIVRDAIKSHSFGDENLFWRIWFEPEEYDAGFITEDSQFNIKVWNAYLDQFATISAIDVTAQAGTSIDNDPLPITIPKFGDITTEVTIYRVGPPLQNTIYTFTINSDDYTCTITGIRIIDWVLEPDWAKGIKMELAFETSIAENRFFKEQRRYLRDDLFRQLSVSSWARGLDAQKIKQSLAYGHDKIFGVPIYSEPCRPTGTITGETVLNFTNDLTKFWHLNNLCSFIIIANHASLISEVKEVSSVGSSSITLVREVVQTFDAASVTVYPIFMATVASLSIIPETDDLLTIDVGFEEYISG